MDDEVDASGTPHIDPSFERISVRLHPATPHSDVVHLFDAPDEDRRIGYTHCGIRFAWGSWKGQNKPLPKCEECW
jgi:hypothetical protein